MDSEVDASRGYSNVKRLCLAVAVGALITSICIYGISQIQFKETTDETTWLGIEEAVEILIYNESFGKSDALEAPLWYFRHDIFLNAHHHYWHVYFTDKHWSTSADNWLTMRGDLFYFMHHELVARYLSSRIVLGLPEIYPLKVIDGTALPLYDSGLTPQNSNASYAPRVNGEFLQSMNTTLQSITLPQLEGYRQNILNSIRHNYFLYPNGTHISINNSRGLGIITNALLNDDSPNSQLYGNEAGYHNFAHFTISAATDPQLLKFPQILGTMLIPSVSLRDPVLYEFHLTIDDIYRLHKEQFQPYQLYHSEFALAWNSTTILSVAINQINSSKQNVLKTKWSYHQFKLPAGLDWHRTNCSLKPIAVFAKMLDFNEFNYKFMIIYEHSQKQSTFATIRIFMAPRYDFNGTRIPFEKQRHLFFTLDRFTMQLSTGDNIISRSSWDSPLTLPWSSYLSDTKVRDCYYGCGLPHHLLLPKGTLEGATFDLVIMVTEGGVDLNISNASCPIAPMWCGKFGAPQIDNFPLGYPFDRIPYTVNTTDTIDDFVRNIPNMKTIKVVIQHDE